MILGSTKNAQHEFDQIEPQQKAIWAETRRKTEKDFQGNQSKKQRVIIDSCISSLVFSIFF